MGIFAISAGQNILITAPYVGINISGSDEKIQALLLETLGGRQPVSFDTGNTEHEVDLYV